jgi:uncharacterized protein (DUF433 family)
MTTVDRLVTEDPEVMGGLPYFAGTRVPVENVLASLDKGIPKERVLASYPFLTDAHIEAALAYQRARQRRALEDMAEDARRLGLDYFD